MSKRTEKNKLYFDIFMHSMNSDMTLEEIGLKYNITKQRVWQIVRFNYLGRGDYYRGYKMYMEKKTEIDSMPCEKQERIQLFRSWLESLNVRLIKSKNDSISIT